ncbi:MAG TPA: DUF3048 C-terminal domain-containing protein [Bellilinea sp.]|nr:DUF3048 C-terminal domain-containing protein [Bellilinea sp.]
MKRVAFLTTINIALMITGGLLAGEVHSAVAQRPSPTPTPSASQIVQVGPNLDQFPEGVNPLTGLPVRDPDTLKLPAVLVSLANFPPSARPLTGLSFAPQVYEIYITEGMTRFLTVFYGDLPTSDSPGPTPAPTTASGSGATPMPTQTAPPAVIGAFETPGDLVSGVRSGREAYVPIVNAFPNGCLVAASKSAAVNVNICKNVFGRDPNNINSAGLTFDQMTALAEVNQNPNRPVNYSGNMFSESAPAGGKVANQVNVFYSWLNQAQWKWDATAQAYMRYEDFGTEAKAGQFRQATDRLTGDPVHFENVVVLFVEHVARTPTIIDLNMGVGNQGKAVVFRDGQAYTGLTWSMLNETYERSTGLARPLRLRNADGTPFALAPGHTWYNVATTSSVVWATDAAAGTWRYRFYAPSGAKQ